MITYHQLRTFLAVARTGSLTVAAKELNGAQPTVSLQLRALRKFLGTPLFERPGGRFQLTPAGEKLRRYAEETLGNLRILQQDTAALRGTVAGPLALGATFVVSRYVLPAALSRFRDKFPLVDLQLHVDVPSPLFSRLAANTLDVACLVGIDHPPGLTVEPLRDDRLVLFVSRRHRLARRRRVTAQDLSEQPLVVPLTVPLREMMERKLRAVNVRPRPGAVGKHHDAVKELVERGLGYSLLIESSVEDDLASGKLVELTLDGPQMMGQIVIAYPTRAITPPIVRSFIDFVRAALKSERKTRGREPRPAKTRR